MFWSWITLSQFHLWGYTKLPSQRLSRVVKYCIIASLVSIGVTSLLVLVSPVQELRSEGVYEGGWEWLDVVYSRFLNGITKFDKLSTLALDLPAGTSQAPHLSYQILPSSLP